MLRFLFWDLLTQNLSSLPAFPSLCAHKNKSFFSPSHFYRMLSWSWLGLTYNIDLWLFPIAGMESLQKLWRCWVTLDQPQPRIRFHVRHRQMKFAGPDNKKYLHVAETWFRLNVYNQSVEKFPPPTPVGKSNRTTHLPQSERSWEVIAKRPRADG